MMSNRKAFDLKMACAWHNGILAVFSLVVFLGQCYETYVESNVRYDMPAHKWTLKDLFSPPPSVSAISLSLYISSHGLPSTFFHLAPSPSPPAPSLHFYLPQARCNHTQNCTQMISTSL